MPRHAHPHRLRLSAYSLQPTAYSLRRPRPGLTLIEMLVATAITLLMMAAVVNLFANLSGSIRNRRAVIELSGQLRQVRQRLALDLAGATCPASTWQRPGDDPGYIELIEGQATDLNPSSLLDGDVNGANGEIEYATSIIPRNNLYHDDDGNDQIDDDEIQRHLGDADSLLPGGLGDYDDILALTVRSEDEPFVVQHNPPGGGGTITVESKVAEVVWFAVENPANGSLGEPGLRSIYRRALVIAPDVDAIPGPPDPQWYFQRYDVSAHYDPSRGAWVPNTLGDLTKRENRFYRSGIGPAAIPYPHALASGGAGYNNPQVQIVRTDLDELGGQDAEASAVVVDGNISSYYVADDEGGQYDDLPNIVVTENSATQPATARPVMAPVPNAENVWQLAQITFGPAPLAMHRVGTPGDSYLVDRTGEDLMLTDALAFDVRLYDPGAPLFVGLTRDVAVEPGDFYWSEAVQIADSNNVTPANFGAYVDLGWDYRQIQRGAYADYLSNNPTLVPGFPRPLFQVPRQAGWHPRLANANGFPFGEPSVYDTWSVHYESDGIDQDNIDGDGRLDTGFDEGTNGIDDRVPYPVLGQVLPVPDTRDGPDDVGVRETAPPYDVPLRGLQVRLRLYERSARQIRETSVTQSLVP